MKKLSLVAIVVIFVSFLSNILPSQATADEPKTFIGTIESFRPVFARPPKWPIARFTAVADNGEKIEVYVLGRDTTVTDIDGKSIESKRPQVGKKVEIKYITGEHEIYGGQRYEAISIRYVPADHVSQPAAPSKPATVSATPGNAVKDNIFVGKIESSGGALRYWWKFTVVADNGEKKEFRVPRGGSTIIQIDGKQRYGEAPRRGRKIEVKYSVTERGDNVTTSMRYVPLDYVQPTASSVSTNAASETTQPAQERAGQTENTFTGTIESFPYGFGHFKSGPPLWPVGMIVVTGNNGGKNNFLIVRDGPNTTVFYDADGKVASVLNDIKGMNDIKAIIGKRVEVKYAITAESSRYANKMLAISVRYLD